MNKSTAIAAVIALAAVFLLFLSGLGQNPAGFFTLLFAPDPNYLIDSLSVYQSDSSVIGSGAAICTGVDVSGATASCDTNLLASTAYRFELVISNSDWFQHGFPDQFRFQNVYAASDVIGSNPTVSYCGCLDDGVYKPGTPSLSGNDVLCALPTGDQCRIEKSWGSETFYFVILTGNDAATGTGDFFIIEEGEDDDTSAEITFSFCQIACDTNSDCDDSNSLTVDTCVNPSACDAYCSNTPCPVACDLNAQCDDSNSLTVDACVNPGACSASCSHTPCSIACDLNAQCDDSNALTVDVCNNPGTCSASCSHEPCTIACDLNSQCDDSNSLTVDTCLNAGTCSASCSHEPCSVACDLNTQCDDSNALTTDICLNPGTCSASCSHSACSVACSSAADCDDSNSLTVDSCVNPGTCPAYCSNSTCSIGCSSDSGCDDSNSMTIDTCTDPGTCSASCSNTACSITCFSNSDCDDNVSSTTDVCNNPGTCDSACSNEVVSAPCTSDSDCDDGDPSTVDSCYRAGTPGAHCINEFVEEEEPEPAEPECTTDSDCDDADPNTVDSCYRAGTPGAHCLHEFGVEPPTQPASGDFSVEFVEELPESAARVSSVGLVVRVLDSEQNPVTGASVSVVDANGSSVELTALSDGQYSGEFPISVGYPLGEQAFRVVVEKEGATGESAFGLDVDRARIRIDVLSPALSKQAVGATIDFRLRLSNPDGSAVEEAEVSAIAAGQEIAFENEGSGIFTASCLLTEQNLGLLEFSVSATDSFGNEGATVITLEVLTAEQYGWFIAGLLFMLLLLLVVLMLVLLFYMRFKHILKLERKRAKYFLMKKHAQVMIAAASGERKSKLEAKAAYLDKRIESNKKSLRLMRKRTWLTLGDIPMDLYFGTRALFFDLRHFPSILRRKRETKESRAELQKINAELSEARQLIKALENDFYKQLVPPDEFKKRLFDYRERIHLLEIRRKKLV